MSAEGGTPVTRDRDPPLGAAGGPLVTDVRQSRREKGDLWGRGGGGCLGLTFGGREG